MTSLMAGHVDVTIGDKTHTLRPTNRIGDKIDEAFGGYLVALDRLRSLSVAAAAVVISIGAGLPRDSAYLEKLRASIRDAGPGEVCGLCAKFVLGYVTNFKTDEELAREADEPPAPESDRGNE